MTLAHRLRITGRVQGVFYRAWTRNQAQDLGVMGWVRNCPDGSVEAHVEGEEAAVAQMIDRMRSGPAGARVDGVEVEDAEAGDCAGFEVRS